MRILVVDDERAIRFSLAELLESDGHEVREAEHAPAALAALDEAPADLVLSDLTMPAMDGLALLEEVRADGVTVVLTTFSVPGVPAGSIIVMVPVLMAAAPGYLAR